MKHVGMNVCADAFVNSAMTGANGGLVGVAAGVPPPLTGGHYLQKRHGGSLYG